MDAGKNLLKPANGEPIVSPDKDMVLGAYYLTRMRDGAKGEGKAFVGLWDATLAFENGFIDMHAKIKALVEGKLTETTYGRMLMNRAFPEDFGYVNEHLTKKILSRIVAKIIERYGIDATAPYIDRIKNIGYEYATLSATTWGMMDTKIPKEKHALIAEGDKHVQEIESHYEEGLLTEKERRERVLEAWNEVKIKIAAVMPKSLDTENPIYSIIDSGSRGSWTQPLQMMGMKGLVSNPKNEDIELPVKSSFKEGLGILEYFISTHGARKGLSDTALKTAAAGYLTRRLVDVSQDVIVREVDCGAEGGIAIVRKEGDAYGHHFADRLFSRTSLEDIRIERKLVVRKGEIITRAQAKLIEETPKIEVVNVRSPITCKATNGICAKCYGLDLSNNMPVGVSEAVGIIAAQSLGEPGTQLTLRTFHVGGISGVDITHGLPRVEEIFEARPPKGKAPLVKKDGVVEKIEDRGLVRIVQIRHKDDTKTKSKKAKAVVDEYMVPGGMLLYIKEGDEVKRGTPLSEGPLDLRELLTYRDLETLEHYIVNEVQKIYVPQSAPINDKHIEIIVRQMLSRVIVKDPGDTEYMVGDVVERSQFVATNREMKRLKKKPAKAILRVMGITRVALDSPSFLSAASFQETSRVLVNAAVEGKIDPLRGLKENVIIGKLIPAGSEKLHHVQPEPLAPREDVV
jgi:DNA-directed RNA polymerase subunit beta'